MSIKSTVNTNISSVTDLNGLRGNLPSSVYAFDMGDATDGAGAVQTFCTGRRYRSRRRLRWHTSSWRR